MANGSVHADNRRLVEKYLNHKLSKNGHAREFHRWHASSLDEPESARRAALHGALREAGDELEMFHRPDFAEMAKRLRATPVGTEQRRFAAVADELFRDGVNWGGRGGLLRVRGRGVRARRVGHREERVRRERRALDVRVPERPAERLDPGERRMGMSPCHSHSVRFGSAQPTPLNQLCSAICELARSCESIPPKESFKRTDNTRQESSSVLLSLVVDHFFHREITRTRSQSGPECWRIQRYNTMMMKIYGEHYDDDDDGDDDYDDGDNDDEDYDDYGDENDYGDGDDEDDYGHDDDGDYGEDDGDDNEEDDGDDYGHEEDDVDNYGDDYDDEDYGDEDNYGDDDDEDDYGHEDDDDGNEHYGHDDGNNDDDGDDEDEDYGDDDGDAFVELYTRKNDPVFSSSWPSLTTSVFSLAALGAVGLTIGAYLTQK
ncbi:hypothetical protein QTP70_029951 [Hemibagrus guttatus]|uniref:Apoptosis regulator Bcl-2 family BH4 domain-containing protein n=1 Tax=Hemibagrus guttatus TaxID=175788 RepID=A0AAE0R8Y6_9TELE|nr:hypothetical protein QTP70_029951 [Hemibagrus guttatus]